MPLTAISRAVSASINDCQLAFVERQPIDIGKAIAQHDQYETCLASLGIAVVSLPAVPNLPDAVFVEDPAIVLDEIAIMTRMGAESRRGESASLAEAIARFRPLRWITEPGTLEGGDVVRIGSTLFDAVRGEIRTQQRRGHCPVGARAGAARMCGAGR